MNLDKLTSASRGRTNAFAEKIERKLPAIPQNSVGESKRVKRTFLIREDLLVKLANSQTAITLSRGKMTKHVDIYEEMVTDFITKIEKEIGKSL